MIDVEALRPWNANNAKARADYRAYPTRACRIVDCLELSPGDPPMWCKEHLAGRINARNRMRARRTR